MSTIKNNRINKVISTEYVKKNYIPKTIIEDIIRELEEKLKGSRYNPIREELKDIINILRKNIKEKREVK